MTNEEFEEKRDFILEQQPKFAAGMRRLRDAQNQTKQVVTQAEEIVARLDRYISDNRSPE